MFFNANPNGQIIKDLWSLPCLEASGFYIAHASKFTFQAGLTFKRFQRYVRRCSFMITIHDPWLYLALLGIRPHWPCIRSSILQRHKSSSYSHSCRTLSIQPQSHLKPTYSLIQTIEIIAYYLRTLHHGDNYHCLAKDATGCYCAVLDGGCWL